MEITFRVEILVLIAVVFFILFSHLFCSCSTVSPMEAFTAMTSTLKEGLKDDEESKKKKVQEAFTGSPYSLTNEKPVNTASWFTPDLSYSADKPAGQGVQDILNRPKQPVPLPPSELLMFANTPFKPECCPNTYSNSSGCACMTVDQYNYLIDRGGNNVPYSEY